MAGAPSQAGVRGDVPEGCTHAVLVEVLRDGAAREAQRDRVPRPLTAKPPRVGPQARAGAASRPPGPPGARLRGSLWLYLCLPYDSSACALVGPALGLPMSQGRSLPSSGAPAPVALPTPAPEPDATRVTARTLPCGVSIC